MLEALGFLKPKSKQTRKLVEDLKGYLSNNRDRMKDLEYRARGLRIRSAAVESANFQVTGTRLKLQGMRWSAEGAAQMADGKAAPALCWLPSPWVCHGCALGGLASAFRCSDMLATRLR